MSGPLNLRILVPAALFSIVIFCLPAFAATPFSFSHIDAEKLERQMWDYMQAADTANFGARVAAGFQAVHFDGATDRDGEIELVQNMHMGKYELSDFKISYETGLVVVTYLARVEHQSLNGELLSAEVSPRMSVWIKTAGGWKWLVHANLNRPKK